GHMLRSVTSNSDCSSVTSQAPDSTKHCRSWLGPTQPGITAPDTSVQSGSDNHATSRVRARSHRRRRRHHRRPTLGTTTPAPGPGSQGGGASDLGGVLQSVIGALGGAPPPPVSPPPLHQIDPTTEHRLLDFLMSP